MARVKGGWTIDTVGWLALIWYLGLLLVCDFLILRGRGRIKTLLVIVTGTAIALVFPFTAIRKANYRAQFRIENGQSLEKVKVSSLWNWWEVAPGEFIPRCLAWRVPIRGIATQRVLDCNSGKLLASDHPNWFRNEVLRVEYYGSDGDPFLNMGSVPSSKKKVFPKTAYILRSIETSPQTPIAAGTNMDWLLNFVDFGYCNTVQIEGVDFSKEAWQHLLSSNYLLRLDLQNTNVESSFMGSNKTHAKLSSVTLNNVPSLSNNAVVDLLDNCPNLSSLYLPYRLFRPSLIQKYFSENKTLEMSFLESPCQIMLWKDEAHLINYSFIQNEHQIDFTDDAMLTLFELSKTVHIDKCRFSANDLFALAKLARLTRVKFTDCTTSQVEFDKLGLAEIKSATGTIVDIDKANQWYIRSLFERKPPSFTITTYRN